MSMRPLHRMTSLRAKLAVVFVFAVGMTVVLVYVLLGYALRNSRADTERLELVRTADALATNTIRIRVDGTPVLPGGVHFLFLMRSGSANRWSTEFNAGDYPFPSAERPPEFVDGEVHLGSAHGYEYAAVPLTSGGRVLGSAYALKHVPVGLVGTYNFLRHYWWQLLLGGAAAAGIALLLARLLAFGMTSPLRAMAHAAARTAQGDYSQRVETRSRDEVGQLAAAFNRMSADLETVEKLRRDLVANVSHELKTPISALRAHLENLLDGVEQPDRRTLSVMLQQSERLSRLVDQLLDLSRLESGDVPLERTEFELEPLVVEAISEVEVARAGTGVKVRREIPEDLPPLWADRERIHQVVFNLLDNAVRFTPRGGEVTVAASRNGDRCEVKVVDTGQGIPPEHLPMLFERFYRVDPSRTREDGGTGIGLAIARSVVEAHGGRIGAGSEVGRGSTFTFDLPLAFPADTDLRSIEQTTIGTSRTDDRKPPIGATTGGAE